MKEIKIDNNIIKKVWNKPKLIFLSLKKTDGGYTWTGYEGASYHPLES